MVSLHSLGAALAFGLAAWAMGPILRTRHLALAAVWAVLWAAALTAAVRVAEPAVARSPLIPLAAAFAAIWIVQRSPAREPLRRRDLAPFGTRATARTAPR
jgi:hypothetical protein